MSRPLAYLDNNATTQVEPRVLAAMLPYFSECYGNPSSLHRFGAEVAADLERAREQVADLLGAHPGEIIFTSGGTEANNAALRGVARMRPARNHIVTTAVEHHAVLQPCERLAAEGLSVAHVGVEPSGALRMGELEAALSDEVALVSIMLANNETGVIFPVAEVARTARARGALVHCDAVNALGKMPIDVNELGVDLLTISAHKIHGPKGAGALYVRRGTPFLPSLLGGPQERERRGGVCNVPGMIGFGAACALLKAEPGATLVRVAALRDRLERAICDQFPQARVIGDGLSRIPNTACLCFEGVEAEPLLMLLSERGVCASSGAACSSGALERSHVLRAMGLSDASAAGQTRFSLSRFTTDAEIGAALMELSAALPRVRASM